MNNMTLNDKEMLNKFSANQIESFKRLLILQETKYQQLKSKAPRWRRPKAEDVAKSMDLNFLYRFGYDYASTHVHPMAQEGEIDSSRLLSPQNHQSLPDATVVRNSILVYSMLIQEGLNATSVQWHVIIYDFIDQLREFLNDNKSRKFRETAFKIGSAWPTIDYCKPRPAT